MADDVMLLKNHSISWLMYACAVIPLLHGRDMLMPDNL